LAQKVKKWRQKEAENTLYFWMKKDIVEPKSFRKEGFRHNCQTLFSDQNNEKVSNLGIYLITLRGKMCRFTLFLRIDTIRTNNIFLISALRYSILKLLKNKT